jgi:hypothetical protein
MKNKLNNKDNMKKVILYSAMALATTLGMSSCGDDFLKLDPTGSVSQGTLSNDQGIDWLLTGAYASMNSMTQTGWMGYASLANYVYGDVMGADANKGSVANDQTDFTQLETYSFNSSNGYISGKWNGIYEAVNRCNAVISMAEKIRDQISDADLIIAQAKYIRGVWMFDAIKNFGAAVPFINVEAYESGTDPLVSNVDESGNYIYIWNLVEQDFKDAIAGLPETWAGDYGRATSWMAKALLAKLYLYWSSPYNGNMSSADHWGQARDLFKDIIDNGKDAKGTKYQLITNYGDLYNASSPDCDWGGESVVDVQMTIQGTQNDTNAPISTWAAGQPGASGMGGWGFYQPTYDFVNSFIVDDNGLPLTTTQARAKDRLTVIKKVVNKKGEKEDLPKTDLTVPVDPRLDITAGRFGVPFLDYGVPFRFGGWVRDYNNGGMYMNKKYLPTIADRSSGLSVATNPVNSAKNLHLIRFADVLLMYAECLIHDGKYDEAIGYINQVRGRAANDFYKVDDYAGLYENLIKSETNYTAADIIPSGLTMDDKVNNKTVAGTASNYRVGLYPTTGNTEATATTALRAERRAELGMEGHHWYDLCRWGIAADFLNSYVDYEGKFFPNKFASYGKNWVMLPIPFGEIQRGNGVIVQNADWK